MSQDDILRSANESIGAYCWPQSVVAGEPVAVFCNAASFDLTVTRQGSTDVQVLAQSGIKAPEADGNSWQPAFSMTVAQEWPSGFYLVHIATDDGTHIDAFFIVRSVERRHDKDAMLVLSTSTWAAYNNWGAPSFYTGAHVSSMRRPLPPGFLGKADQQDYLDARARQDRKALEAFFARGHSTWSLCAGWGNWEILFARWAERLGLQIDYAASHDLDRDPDLLTGYPMYLSVGHDEYWSKGMRDTVEGYVDGGGHAAFFSGNTAFWQIRFEDDYSNVIAYKNDLDQDPVYGTDEQHLLASMWSDPLVGRPENTMTGVSFTRGGYARVRGAPTGSGGYSIWRPDHWALEGSRLLPGDLLGAEAAVIGYECDGCDMALEHGRPVPTGVDGTPRDFEIVGTAPAHLWTTEEAPGTLPDHYIGELNWVAERLGGADTPQIRELYAYGSAVMGSFRRGQGEVFTTGCTDWAYGLGDPGVDRVTRNVLRRFGWSDE